MSKADINIIRPTTVFKTTQKADIEKAISILEDIKAQENG